MSMDEEKRAIVVRLEIEKAYDTLEESTILADRNKWSGAANRLYYALFHAVSALLIHDAHTVKSHKGAGVLFNNLYVKTHRIPPQYGTLFGRLEDLREEGDYNCHYKITEEEFHSSVEPAKEMIDTIAAMVKE